MTDGKRLPKQVDFPSSVEVLVTPPPSGQPPTNILILLHGLGDSHVPFAQLGAQLSLPSTACVSLKGLNPLPFEATSFHWSDDVIFDSTTNGLDPDGGFKAATTVLVEAVIQKVLVEMCGYKTRDIVLFGLGQGGMAALNAAANIKDELGGVVSVGGALPGEAPATLSPRSKTPILVCSGVDSPYVTSGAEDKLKRVFQTVQVSRYRRPGDTMPKDRGEMLPIMQFFASRLRQGAPEGTVELI